MTAKKKASSKKPAASKARKKKSTAASRSKSPGKDFSEVFAALCAILTPYEGRLAARQQGASHFYMESHEPTYRNRPMYFAGVKTGKNYISFHLLPIYMSPELNRKIPPELKKRMQGKACFNFAAIDPLVFGQLTELTSSSYEAFKDRGWL